MDIFDRILGAFVSVANELGQRVLAALFALAMGVLFYFLWKAGLLGLGR
jgi:hypothetical protein